MPTSTVRPALTTAAPSTLKVTNATTLTPFGLVNNSMASTSDTNASLFVPTRAPCVLLCEHGKRLESPFCRCDCDSGYYGDLCDKETSPCVWQSCAKCRLQDSPCEPCPLEAAVRCPNGECVSDVSECEIAPCAANSAAAATGEFVCVAGPTRAPHCLSSPLTCLRKAEALELCPASGCCWDGSSRNRNGTQRCVPVPACPPLFVRCPDGRCRDALLSLPCSYDATASSLLADIACVAPLTRCADARCYLSAGPQPCAAVPHEGCPLGQLACWSGRCVSQWQECVDQCPHPLWKCDDGSCSDACQMPRRLFRPPDIDVLVYGDADAKVRILSNGKLTGVPALLATVYIPAGALVRAGAPAASQDYANVTHTLRIRSVPMSEQMMYIGADALLSAAFRIDVVPPIVMPLVGRDRVVIEFPTSAVATTSLEMRDLCVASFDVQTSPSDTATAWRCAARLAPNTVPLLDDEGMTRPLPGSTKMDGNRPPPPPPPFNEPGASSLAGSATATAAATPTAWRTQLSAFGSMSVRYVPLGPLETAIMVSDTRTPPQGEPQPDESLITALVIAFATAAFVCILFGAICAAALVAAQRRKRLLREKRDMQQMARAAAEADVVAGVPSGTGASDRMVMERQRMLQSGVSPLLMACVDFLTNKGVFVRGIFAEEPRQGTAVARKAEVLFRQWHGARYSDAEQSDAAARVSFEDPAGGIGTASHATDSDGSIDHKLDTLFAGGDSSPSSTPPHTLSRRRGGNSVPEFASDTDPLVIAHVVRLYFRSLRPLSVFSDQFFRMIDRIPEYRATPVPVSISSVLLSTELTSSYDDDDGGGGGGDENDSAAESARSTTASRDSGGADGAGRATVPMRDVATQLPIAGRATSRIDQLAHAVQALDEINFCTLQLVCGLLHQIHSNASINGMTAGDLQQALYNVLLPPSKGDYKAVIGDLIANFGYVFGANSSDGDESSSADNNKLDSGDSSVDDLLGLKHDDDDDDDGDEHDGGVGGLDDDSHAHSSAFDSEMS
jgi:hypothetical protein